VIRELTGHLVVLISHNHLVPIKKLLETFCLHQVNFKVTVYIFIMKSDTGTYWSLGGSNFKSFLPMKKLLMIFRLHQVNFKVTVYIFIMESDTGTYWSLGGSNF